MNTAKVGTSAGRLQTGSKVNPDALKTIGFTTNVRVEERAVTRQGLEGLKNKKDTGKINRKIQDKYYYTELLKKKINEITNEIGNMRNEIDYINQDVTAYNNMNKTYETLSKDVQNLEGELADYNLAGDKYRSMMRAEDIEAVFNHIKINNKKKREESDYLYLEKAKVMEEVHKTEYEINKIMQAVDQKLLELDPEQKIEYEQLKEENSTLLMKILDQREELNRLNMEIMEGENLLKNNPNKREASRIKDVINQLLRKKEELEFQTNELNIYFNPVWAFRRGYQTKTNY
jgi:intraflagellar transport protein 74